MATFGQRLRELRRENRMSAKELAIALDIAQSSISRYENDLREPRRDFLEKVSAYFNVSIDYLLGKTDEQVNRDGHESNALPNYFENVEDAIAFLLKQPTLVAFGGYDLSKLSSDELIDFANDILRQIEVVSYKYRK